ncbi:hypothetical protein EYF80_059024 [Liparis tanakae]|uniref:Uncharacterized protein n=1 Tax=Liparis tanakae TaxID=230148 RepID=A0A4Z2ER30_9TELE|nr:hypothetical protein EYF80_059024 [Liparis tanakae]
MRSSASPHEEQCVSSSGLMRSSASPHEEQRVSSCLPGPAVCRLGDRRSSRILKEDQSLGIFIFIIIFFIIIFIIIIMILSEATLAKMLFHKPG